MERSNSMGIVFFSSHLVFLHLCIMLSWCCFAVWCVWWCCFNCFFFSLWFFFFCLFCQLFLIFFCSYHVWMSRNRMWYSWSFGLLGLRQKKKKKKKLVQLAWFQNDIKHSNLTPTKYLMMPAPGFHMLSLVSHLFQCW